MAIQISLPDDIAWQILDLLDGAMFAAPDGIDLAPLSLLNDKIMAAATRRAGRVGAGHCFRSDAKEG